MAEQELPNQQYLKAFLALQGELVDPKKAGENDHFRSRYVPLQTLLASIRPLLTKHGFCLRQMIHEDTGKVVVETRLSHISGYTESSYVPVVTDKTGPQALGSAITYARRYGAGSILPIAGTDEDDDGEEAEGRAQQPQTQLRGRKAPAQFDNIEEAIASAERIKTQPAMREWIGKVAASSFTGSDKDRAVALYRELQTRFETKVQA